MRAQSIFLIEFFEICLVKLTNWPAPKSISLTTKFCVKHSVSCVKHTLKLSYEKNRWKFFTKPPPCNHLHLKNLIISTEMIVFFL